METCDHTSVGVLILNEQEELLVIERARPPLFWAPPAGHIDEHGSDVRAAVEEVSEEVGIAVTAESLRRVLSCERMTNNQCRRSSDGWHDWTVFAAEVDDVRVHASPDEVKRYMWASAEVLRAMAYDKTSPMKLEPVWVAMLEKIGQLSLSNYQDRS